MSSGGASWKDLSGLNNWDGLLDPMDSDLRRYLIHYGSMVAAVGDAFINEDASKYAGMSRYAKMNLLDETGVAKADPLSKYEVTKYFYSNSRVEIPLGGYFVKPRRVDAERKGSNWMGYVAVSTDEGKQALGRRDILIAWRGTTRPLEWNLDSLFNFRTDPFIFGEKSGSLVCEGWYNIYTYFNTDKIVSVRDQIRSEVQSLLDKYKGEEISITTAGHSLGSPLATLTAADLAANPLDKDRDILVTAFLFASPKVGDVNFKNAFSKFPNLRALRIYNPHDIVPNLPPPYNSVPYEEVGVGFEIKTTQSKYVNTTASSSPQSHDLMMYLHGIDGYVGSGGGFEPKKYFGVAQLNKYHDFLIQGSDGYYAPVGWWVEKNKGMVQQDDGTWILDDHETDDGDKNF